MADLKKLTTALYSKLEQLQTEHDELTDTDVREALYGTLNFYFVWAKPLDPLPINYEMFTAEGDAAVTEAVNQFLRDAVPAAERAGIPVGQARLDILQDRSITTPDGNEFDLYIGSSETPPPPNPLWEGRFQPGDYDDE